MNIEPQKFSFYNLTIIEALKEKQKITHSNVNRFDMYALTVFKKLFNMNNFSTKRNHWKYENNKWDKNTFDVISLSVVVDGDCIYCMYQSGWISFFKNKVTNWCSFDWYWSLYEFYTQYHITSFVIFLLFKYSDRTFEFKVR